ncbi:motility associated factor glycosyltransferase family protein [Pseudoalteromonas sp. McH1-7]|uniref:motility associated factor glycosyltransferase family protein n=1 Tax=unclassified Pseudoalteromonas TaxID=194690 RepID=UPI001590D47A|nr:MULTISPECIES: 6-hydroxymethylpterin diphosphokinase MptE-like protein [unclassified Pseudoalteromonas]NUZ09604.1 motility associated factor glycosyltransferase family protein [Pseudoalteromonas sp. McH1-7]USD29606.1 motility associated factor glycosyltransferase family protein [Pseudoalteromonas sp. SCSIO 43201]
MTDDKSLENQIQELSDIAVTSIEQSRREAEFATEANRRFADNLNSFSQYYPSIAQAIEEYNVDENFCLHVESDGFANIDVLKNNARFYSSEPSKQIEQQVEKAIAAPVFTLTEYTKNNSDYRDMRVHVRYMRELSTYLQSLSDAGEPRKLTKLPEHFPTAMIFGVGLGYHIPKLLDHTSFSYTFIIEPDFKLFFASLFCIDWSKIIKDIDSSGGCLFFYLGCKPDELVGELKKTVENIGAFSIVRSFCYQHYPLPDINESIANFFKDYFQFQFGHGFYNDAVTGLSHSYFNVAKGVPFYDAKRAPVSEFKDVPIIIVGNGPSLDVCQDFIINNQDKAIIFACGTALTSLLKMGVMPDFHILVERPYRNYQAVLDMAPKEVYSELNLLGVNTIYPDTVDLYKWVGFSLKGNEAGTDFINVQLAKKGHRGLSTTAYSNPLVSNTGLSYALHLGFKNIYLCGVDNGRSVDGASHSKLSVYSDENKETQFKYWPMKLDGSALPGNLGGVVETNQTYRMSNRQLEDLISIKPATIFNIGDGALIKGTLPTTASDLMDLDYHFDKQNIIGKIKAEFEDLGLQGLGNQSLDRELTLEVFDHLISIAKESVSTVNDASNNLQRQERYLFAFRNTRYSHIFHIIKGSLLYYHCPMITHLFKYDDSENSLGIYKDLNQLWIAYLEEMKEHCSAQLLEKCDWELYHRN